jgi:adenine/guanine phosphoribosyltransferase-like PRPP-binding protein
MTEALPPQDFWQVLHPPNTFAVDRGHERFFPATLADGRQLLLPIRPLDERHALASLIVNQASFAVLDALAEDLAARLRSFSPEVVAGLPTLGLTLAEQVARKLGHSRYAPLSTSRKFWYDEALSAPISSITTPEQTKRLYMDPRMLPLIDGARVALIDDVISSGASIRAGLSLLLSRSIAPVTIGAAMLQSERWRDALARVDLRWPAMVRGCFCTPLLEKGKDELWHAPRSDNSPREAR